MKTLSDRIAKRIQLKSLYAPHSNLALVLALRKDIQQALDDGWSVQAIHQTLREENKVMFGYQAFRRHVNRLQLRKPKQPKTNEEQH